MLAEQIEDERDARILVDFGLDDIDSESLRIYRQMLKNEKPGHPYLEQNDFDLLKSLRGWRTDRQSKESGLTLGGLLMFGKCSSIQEAVPHYFVDYQEQVDANHDVRWIDRLVPDGTWSGNLFEFYRRVYRKLVVDLKVPFALNEGLRQDDTPVHVALREALVNTLVHADYTGRISVLVVKRLDLFIFRNPGALRLPIEQVIRGGESDCRNRIVHQMFLLVGLGERGGSGMPKIYAGWKSQHWRPPALSEQDEPEQTLLSLQMADLLPDSVLAQLHERFGEQFGSLSYTERLIVATAAIERVVRHSRLLEICDTHAHDLTTLLSRLVKQGLLESEGRSRGTVYFLPGAHLPTPEQVFVAPRIVSAINDNVRSSSEHSLVSSEHSGRGDGARDRYGRLLSPYLPAPIIDYLEILDSQFHAELALLAQELRQAPTGSVQSSKQKRPGRARMEQIILAVCSDHYVMLSALAQLLCRNPDGLRQQYLSSLVSTGRMVLAFPKKPTHEKQAYRTAEVSRGKGLDHPGSH